MPSPQYEPKLAGTFEYFQMNRQKFALDMKVIATTIAEMMQIGLRENTAKGVYLYSATEIRKLMAQVRKVEKLYFGGQS